MRSVHTSQKGISCCNSQQCLGIIVSQTPKAQLYTWLTFPAYHSLQNLIDAPFEIRPSPGKGWGAFARKPIGRGSIILAEKPLFIIWKPHELIAEVDVQAAFQKLAPNQKQQFLCLRDHASRPFTSMEEAFSEKSFALPVPFGNGISVHGLFLLLSRFNHSCIPNTKIPLPKKGTVTSFATRDIVAGEEITFCYETNFEGKTRHERHQALRFVCDCRACRINTPFQQLSDMRRTLIRGLQYLKCGRDIHGCALPPIIFDPKVRQAAERFEFPLSARLIHDLFIMALLEEEELLDDFMVEGLRPAMMRVTTAFEIPSNASIARLAMTQGTWLGKFCTALGLDGRADVADRSVSEKLRKVTGRGVQS